MTLDDLLALRGLDAASAATALGVDPGARKAITNYGRLRDVDALDAADSSVRCILRDDRVVLVYVGRAGLPAGLDPATVAKAADGEGEILASRQGKKAQMHVAAGAGMAWSEMDGAVGFLELFAPTTVERYREEIYLEPGPFKR